uniref:Uncharacterized protein n=1 Tax=viral metagenome TaxID=1070528 RepID=A0A6C0AC65_9ZZZZ
MFTFLLSILLTIFDNYIDQNILDSYMRNSIFKIIQYRSKFLYLNSNKITWKYFVLKFFFTYFIMILLNFYSFTNFDFFTLISQTFLILRIIKLIIIKLKMTYDNYMIFRL